MARRTVTLTADFDDVVRLPVSAIMEIDGIRTVLPAGTFVIRPPGAEVPRESPRTIWH